METIKLTDYSEWLIAKALLTGYFLRGELPELITNDSGYYIYLPVDKWEESKQKAQGTYKEPTAKDEVQLTMSSKIILLRTLVTKEFKIVDLENLKFELNFAIREYNPKHEAEMAEIRERIKNRKPTHKFVQQAGKPKGYLVQVSIDYPHETAKIKTD